MNDGFGNLGELFPVSEVKCRIKGCKNLLQISGAQTMHNIAQGHNAKPEQMCEECYSLFLKLADIEVPCAKPGCNGVWTWNRFQQLESRVQGYDGTPPKRFCSKCYSAMQEIEEIERPCRIRGCKNTWVWTRRMQAEANGAAPPARLCEECFQTLRSLHDQELPCRIRGCQNKVQWNRYQQLEYLRSGKKLSHPPARMCDSCRDKLRGLEPREEPCKIQGCEGKWVYSPYEQLEELLRTPEGQEPATPSKMCAECYSFFTSAKDLSLACKNRGCENKWLWTRSMQLGYRLRNKSGRPPSRMCEQCSARLKELSDLEMPCQEKGCTRTWKYSAEEQLRDQLLNRRPPQRRCQSCQDFLSANAPQEIACQRCGQIFSWSTQEQLQHALGTFDKPGLCANCNSQVLAEIRPPEAKPIPGEQKFSIRIPVGGRWNSEMLIRDWPPHVSKDSLQEMEEAEFRVVCVGDDMVHGNDDPSKAWPALLQTRLQARYGRVAVLNSGIKSCSTILGSIRFPRDVTPFAPQLLIFSFNFADVFFRQRSLPRTDEAMAERLAELAEDFQAFAAQLAELPPDCKILAWLPGPVFPQNDANHSTWRENLDPDTWAARYYEACLRQSRRLCSEKGLPVHSAKTLFEAAGSESLKRWLSNWYLPNDIGAGNIANWLDATIVTEKLLPGAGQEE